jgi:hypothetical protein
MAKVPGSGATLAPGGKAETLRLLLVLLAPWPLLLPTTVMSKPDTAVKKYRGTFGFKKPPFFV